ncbi:hypothetical protein [Pseudomonas protegens]|uniref:hypothetical protein n=1 Tax=Pseudomonas protegens TaxID=380021 RepID=UPI0037F986CF
MDEKISKLRKKALEEIVQANKLVKKDSYPDISQVIPVIGTIVGVVLPILEVLRSSDWKFLSEKINDLPAQSRKAMTFAAEQGWFFNWQGSLRQTVKLIESLKTTNTEEADDVLTKHYTERMDAYCRLLTAKYPHRKQAIEAAVSAHKNLGDTGYTLSIPVFLAQSDGLLAEISKLTNPMSKQNKVIKATTWLEEKLNGNTYATDLLHPILQLKNLDLLKDTTTRNKETNLSKKTFNGLNRHQVMHGEKSDYGTETNSLKAFSFLIFIGLHLPSVLSEIETNEQQ